MLSLVIEGKRIQVAKSLRKYKRTRIAIPILLVFVGDGHASLLCRLSPSGTRRT